MQQAAAGRAAMKAESPRRKPWAVVQRLAAELEMAPARVLQAASTEVESLLLKNLHPLQKAAPETAGVE